MSYQLNLDDVMKISQQSPTDCDFVFCKLVEEMGELARAINQPERCDEPAVGEMADILNSLLDLYQKMYGPDLTLLQKHLDKKNVKWAKITGVEL